MGCWVSCESSRQDASISEATNFNGMTMHHSFAKPRSDWNFEDSELPRKYSIGKEDIMIRTEGREN